MFDPRRSRPGGELPSPCFFPATGRSAAMGCQAKVRSVVASPPRMELVCRPIWARRRSYHETIALSICLVLERLLVQFSETLYKRP